MGDSFGMLRTVEQSRRHVFCNDKGEALRQARCSRQLGTVVQRQAINLKRLNMPSGLNKTLRNTQGMYSVQRAESQTVLSTRPDDLPHAPDGTVIPDDLQTTVRRSWMADSACRGDVCLGELGSSQGSEGRGSLIRAAKVPRESTIPGKPLGVWGFGMHPDCPSPGQESWILSPLLTHPLRVAL